MIEIFRHNNKWRIRIVNETLEFPNLEEMLLAFKKITKTKQDFEPYKHNENEQTKT